VLGEDCLPNETCSVGCCRPTSELEAEQEEEEEEEEEPPPWVSSGEQIGLWVHLGLGFGAGVVTGSAKEPRWYDPGDGSLWYGPDDYAHRPTFVPTDRQEVAVSGMALSGFVMRLGVGYNILPFLSVELNYRFNAPFGDDVPWLIEARAAYWFLTGPQHRVSAFVGGGGGVVTLMVPRVVFNQVTGDPPSKVYEPFYKPSGYGQVAFGGQYRYNFTELFGVGAELAMNVLFPSVAFSMDFLADVSLSF
jgi:hypothetical protein